MIPYSIRYTRDATQAIYQIERGIAGEVTLAIKSLRDDPKPFRCFALDDPPNVYVIKVSEYYVTYAINDESHTIIIVLIEPATTGN